MSFIQQMSDEDVLNLFRAQEENGYVKNMLEKNEVNRICRGDVTEAEKMELLRHYQNAILKRAFNNQEVISTKMARSYFSYQPSPLIQACTVSNALSLEVPVIKYDGGLKVTNTFAFDTTSSVKVMAEVSETLVQDQDLIAIFTELLNSEVNLKIRQAIENTLESNVTLSANTIVEAVSKIDPRHIENLSIVMSPANYLDSSFLPKIDTKIPVYFADVDAIYVGNLKTIHVNFVQDQFKFDKDIKKGILTLLNDIFSLGTCVKDTSAIVKIA